MLSLHVCELVYAWCLMNLSLVILLKLVVQLIILLFLDSWNISKALASYRVLILMEVIYSSSH